jgi:hypothetical protein
MPRGRTTIVMPHWKNLNRILVLEESNGNLVQELPEIPV